MAHVHCFQWVRFRLTRFDRQMQLVLIFVIPGICCPAAKSHLSLCPPRLKTSGVRRVCLRKPRLPTRSRTLNKNQGVTSLRKRRSRSHYCLLLKPSWQNLCMRMFLQDAQWNHSALLKHHRPTIRRQHSPGLSRRNKDAHARLPLCQLKPLLKLCGLYFAV